MLEGGFDEVAEQRLRMEGGALELRVELAPAEPRMVSEFGNLDEVVSVLGVDAADYQAGLLF